MAYYAFLNENNIVISVISGVNEDMYQNDNEIIVGGTSENWENWYSNFKGFKCKRTSYNTRGGVHYQSDNNKPSIDQSKAFRKNYAGIGFYYDEQRDAFIPPKPFPSWTLNEESCLWDSPLPYPNDGKMYRWNEDILNWEEINLLQ